MGWRSQLVFSPERKSGLVILTNGEGGTALIWTDLMKPRVDGVVFRVGPPRARAPLLSPATVRGQLTYCP